MNEESKSKEILLALAAPFYKTVGGKKRAAHKWRPKDKIGTNKMKCYPYIDRYLVFERLNEVLGVDGWQTSISEMKNGASICELSCFIAGNWITKTDIGTPGDYEKEKGSVSDSIKRAATQFGVGMYLGNISPFFIDAKIGKNGKLQPVDKSSRPLYGDQLHAFINGLSSEQGILAQLLMFNSKLWERADVKKLWNDLKN